MSKEKWDVCTKFPGIARNKMNYICELTNGGRWKCGEMGKWLFTIEKKGHKNVPSFLDQRNFFTGLFEAEWRNDNFKFKDGTSRPPQREIKVEMFKRILEEISERADVKDTKQGISYYINNANEYENETDSN